MMLMFRRGLTNVQRREKGENISLDRGYQDFNKTYEKHNNCGSKSDRVTLKYKDQSDEAEQYNVSRCDRHKKTNHQRNRFCENSDHLN